MSKEFDVTKTNTKDWSKAGDFPYDKLPAYRTATICNQECLKRFGKKKIPTAYRELSREILSNLSRVLVLMVRAKLGLNTNESVKEALDLAISIQIGVRTLNDLRAISIKDYAQISSNVDSLVKQLVGWSKNIGVWEDNKNVERFLK